MKNLTKYEFARVVGARALQLSMGAPPVIKLKEKYVDPIIIARREFEDEMIPLAVFKKN